MTATQYQRLRMEVILDGSTAEPVLPSPFQWVPWDDALLDAHAETMYRSFAGQIDGRVFPVSIGSLSGCRETMRRVRRNRFFLPSATWLISCPDGYAGMIQGYVDRGPIGAIANLGVVAAYRGMGLGRALLRQAFQGFVQAGLRRACVQATAENLVAVRLYESVGFRCVNTHVKTSGG